jgi:two-component system, NarL family, invasion response regulator UvrY
MTPEKNIKVALVDDHVLLRSALATLINNFKDCTVVVEANHGKELLNKLETGIHVDVVLLDFNMPVMDGLETAKSLQSHYPEINILMLTMYDSELILIRLLQAGVKGFLKKDIHPDEFRQAILSVTQTGFYYSHDSTGKLVNLFRKQNDGHFPQIEKNMLSEMEIQFLRMASTELTYKEIAQQSGLNPRAVDNIRDSLFQKLNVRSRVGLAMYAIRHGLVSI